MVPRGAARGAGALGVLVALAGLGGARAQPESVAGFLLRREEEPAVRAAAVDALNDIDVDSSPPQEEEVAGEESGLLAFLLQQAGDDLSAPEDPRLASFLLETDILAVANASARFAGFAGGAQAAQLAPGQPTLGELLGGALGPDPAAAPNLRVGAPDLVRPVGDLQFNCPDTIAVLVRDDSELSTLALGLERTGLDVTLSGPGPATLFAPTDRAWASLAGRLEAGGAEAQQILDLALEDLLLYQMTGRLEDVEPGPGRAYEAVTLSGLPVVVAVSPTGVAVNGQAAVLRTASACNGVIAVIDEVLIPLAAADDGGDPEPEYGFDYEDFDYQFPFPVPDDGGGGGQVPADADCAPSDCCDVPPPPDAVTGVQYSCAEQVGFGKCGEAFMQGFCRLSCGRCLVGPRPDQGGDDLGDEYSPLWSNPAYQDRLQALRAGGP